MTIRDKEMQSLIDANTRLLDKNKELQEEIADLKEKIKLAIKIINDEKIKDKTAYEISTKIFKDIGGVKKW